MTNDSQCLKPCSLVCGLEAFLGWARAPATFGTWLSELLRDLGFGTWDFPLCRVDGTAKASALLSIRLDMSASAKGPHVDYGRGAYGAPT